MAKCTIYNMDCTEGIEKIPDDSISCVVTSPPYADSRSKTYGGIHPDRYVEWFLPRAAEFRRVVPCVAERGRGA